MAKTLGTLPHTTVATVSLKIAPPGDRFERIRSYLLAYEMPILIGEKAYGMSRDLARGIKMISPFLSRDVSSYALSLHANMLIGERWKQVLLKAAELAGVPAGIMARYEKEGLGKQRTSLPWRYLIYDNEEFRGFVESLVVDPIMNQIGLIDRDFNVHNFIYEENKDNPNGHKKAWPLIVLELWLREKQEFL